MDTRKNAANLSVSERDAFLEAVIRLKYRQAPGGPPGVSVYDQFVALHSAVFSVFSPGLPPGETVNFGHWNIGFCPWHRQYLREFEWALQSEVPGVTIPYWKWEDHTEALTMLFSPDFLGSLGQNPTAPLVDSVFRNPVPVAERPAWWPEGATGFPVHPDLEAGFGAGVARGSGGGSTWPPSSNEIDQLEKLVIEMPGINALWYFWLVLEQGEDSVARATHNAAHNFIGGHMASAPSPNDPAFWLHHANVDRIWDTWQRKRLQDVPGSTPDEHWPAPDDLSPFDGRPAPPGHRIDDMMWPWVGTAAGYDADADPVIKQMLPDFTGVPAVTVRDVLDTETMDATGYRYA